MRHLNTTLCIINFHVPFEGMNDVKASAISNAFTESFETRLVQETPIGKIFFLGNSQKGELITIQPNNISYKIESNTKIEMDENKISENINKIFEVLLIEKKVQGNILVAGKIDSLGDSMSETKEIFSNISIALLSKGLGIRCFFENEIGIDEYKVEPFLADNTKLHIEEILNINEITSLEKMLEAANDVYTSFTVDKKEILKKLNILV